MATARGGRFFLPLRVAGGSFCHCAWRAVLFFATPRGRRFSFSPLRVAGGSLFRQKPFRPVSGTFQSGRRYALHPQWLLVALQCLLAMPRLQAMKGCGGFNIPDS
jgi:hypothetical protein